MIRIFMVGFSDNKGGVEAYISNLCANLDSNKFEVIYSMPKMLIDNKEWTRPINRHNYVKYYKFWQTFFRENHFDVLYYNTCDIVSLDMVRFAKRAKIPVRIIHAHSTGIQQELSLFHRLSEKYSRKQLGEFATHLFACSETAGKWMFDDRDYLIIKNGIDLLKYRYSHEMRIKLKKEYELSDRIVLGCVGRLEAVKNISFAIDIMENLLKQNDNISLILIGEGSRKKELQEMAKTKGLEKYICFLGARNDVNDWMSAMDCLLMPSIFEGLPFVLVEAQATGLPCVVSGNVSKEADITGLLEFVSLDEDKDIWSSKILEVTKLERRETAPQLIEKGYSIKETADKVSNILFEILENKEV